MGIAASIVSVVIKSVVGDKFGNGLAKDLIGISIDGISEKSIKEITDFINREKNKIDNILSREYEILMNMPQINFEYVEAEIKDLLSKIDITDELFRQCRYDSMNLSAFLWNKYCECKEGNIEYEREIKRCLFEVAEALINLVCESENFEKDVLIHISNAADDTNVGLQKLSEYMDSNFGKLSVDNQAILEILKMILKQNQGDSAKNKEKRHPVKSRTQEYADKWNANMFLNDFNKHDKKDTGKYVTLGEVYKPFHLPSYVWRENEEKDSEYDLIDVLTEYIEERKNNNKMLLILGQPGIGKSTLITWILNNITNNINEVLVYQFASDLINVKWENIKQEKKEQRYDIVDEIINALDLYYENLNGKVLIIDGFDEISLGNERTEILNQLYIKLVKGKQVRDFSLIITCRENYIQNVYRIECDYITLQPWNEGQIQSFCSVYKILTQIEVSDNMMEKILENRNIFGIPLILYMVLALNISIEKDSSIVDVYDQIFSLDGGIYERCLHNRRYENPHWIRNIKEQIHLISKKIAIWIFENKPEEAYIPQYNYNYIVNEIAKKSKYYKEEINHSFKIGNYFKAIRHCEGIETERLYFVHRSIYEYFVAETIYSSIESAMIALTDISQVELASNIPKYLTERQISYTIGEYLKYKIINLYNKMNNEKKSIFYRWWETAVLKMMKEGMFYHTPFFPTNQTERYFLKNNLEKEVQCFSNLIEILRLLLCTSNREYIMQDSDSDCLEEYIRHCSKVYKKKTQLKRDRWFQYRKDSDLSGLNLSKMFLAKLNLEGINLEGADLRDTDLHDTELNGANLTGAKLNGANLVDVKLKRTILSNVDLTNTDLTNAQLQGADLTSADLTNANLTEANLIGADLQKCDVGGQLNFTGDANFKEAKLIGTYCDENQIFFLQRQNDLERIKVYIYQTHELLVYCIIDI